MSDFIKLSPKVLEIQNSNDIYMTLKMVIMTSNTNLNGARFTESFIDGVVVNQGKYKGIPVVVNRTKLENDVFDSLTHEFDGVSLNTDMIGSFVSFSKEQNEDGSSFSLVGEARIMKRFPKTCEAIMELYTENKLRFSCEVLVYEYSALLDDGTREISYSDGKNQLFANAIVTNPAEVNAKPILLVAELTQAFEEDLEIEKNQASEGGQEMSQEQPFNNGKEIKYNGTLENCSLSFEEISNQIYTLLNYDSNGEWVGYCWIVETYPDHIICETPEGLFHATYSVEDDKVVVAPKEGWIQGQYVFKPMSMMNSLEEENEQLKEELNFLKVEHATLQEKVNELNEKDEALISLNNQIATLQEEIASLTPFKAELEKVQEEKAQAELQEKISALKIYALKSNVIAENEFEENEELKNALMELNTNFVKSLIADRIVMQLKDTLQDEKPPEGITVVCDLEGKDLLPKGSKRTILYSPRKNK